MKTLQGQQAINFLKSSVRRQRGFQHRENLIPGRRNHEMHEGRLYWGSYQQKMILVLIFWLGATSIALNADTGKDVNPQSRVDAFRELLSNPKIPIYGSALIERNISVSDGLISRQVLRPEAIEFIWASNRVTYSQHVSLQVTNKAGVSSILSISNHALRDGDRFSIVFPRDQSVYEWEGHPNEPLDERNRVLAMYNDALNRISTVLNMGIPVARPGTVKWNGSHFSAFAIVPQTSMSFDGDLLLDSKQRPGTMLLTRTFATASLTNIIKYTYGSNTLPDRISADQIQDGQTSLLQRITIRDLRQPLPGQLEAELARLRNLAERMTNHFIVQGRKVYERLVDGAIVESHMFASSSWRPVATRTARLVFIFLALGFTLGFALFVSGLSRRDRIINVESNITTKTK